MNYSVTEAYDRQRNYLREQLLRALGSDWIEENEQLVEEYWNAVVGLYGAVGEGLGHATRSRVVARHLIDQGHEVKMVASGRAFPYLSDGLPDVEEIWGLLVRARATVRSTRGRRSSPTFAARGTGRRRTGAAPRRSPTRSRPSS